MDRLRLFLESVMKLVSIDPVHCSFPSFLPTSLLQVLDQRKRSQKHKSANARRTHKHPHLSWTALSVVRDV